MNWVHQSLIVLSVITISACANNPTSKPDSEPNKSNPIQSGNSSNSSNSGNSDNTGNSSNNILAEDVNYNANNGQSLSTAAKNSPTNRTIFFGYDISQLSGLSREILDQHASYLQTQPQLQIRIEGHADERGSREYNLALGEQRALAVQRYLTISGIAKSRLKVFSYGEEKAINMGHTENAWQQNRRASLIY